MPAQDGCSGRDISMINQAKMPHNYRQQINAVTEAKKLYKLPIKRILRDLFNSVRQKSKKSFQKTADKHSVAGFRIAFLDCRAK